MTTLEDLWYGNIRPVENFIEGNMEYKSLLRLVSKNREVLESELSPKQFELFEKYNLSVNEMNVISETAAFQYGFSLGVKLMMACQLVYPQLINSNNNKGGTTISSAFVKSVSMNLLRFEI